MSTEIVAGFTVLHITIAVIALLIAGIALQSLRKEKPVGEDLLRNASCPSCGWKGRLSKYQRKCPGCNGEL